MILIPHRCFPPGQTASLPNIALPNTPPFEIATRPADSADEEFLYLLYAAGRREEVAAFGWPPAVQDSFLGMQYRARSQSYAASYPHAERLIVLVDGEPAGGLIVLRTASEIRLVDIALLPACRGRGIGSVLVDQLAAEAAGTDRPLRLSVATNNPGARRLYERLGFRPISEDAMYIEMERPGR